ncbi:MAG: hypothetical protein ACN2B6_12235 [Rickettsiales bacterium]
MKDVKAVLLNDGGYEHVFKQHAFPTKPISAKLDDDGGLWVEDEALINAGVTIPRFSSAVVAMGEFLFVNDHDPEFEIVE